MLLCTYKCYFNALDTNNAASPGKYWCTQPAIIMQAPTYCQPLVSIGVPSYYYWIPIMLPPCGKYWCTQTAATKIKQKLLAEVSSFSLDENG